MPTYTDPELVLQWQSGQERAFDALYLRYITPLYKEAFSKVKSAETARELVQDVFMEVFLKKETLQVESSLWGYLQAAIRNKVYNYFRMQLVRDKYKAYLSSNSGEQADTNIYTGYEAKETYERVLAAIKQLPPQRKAVFLMSREEHLSNKEIAELLGISINTVEQHMRKALQVLRKTTGGFPLIIFL